MTTLLFILIMLIYIGLGVPDSSLGASWPAIYTQLGFDIGLNSLFTFIISGCTICSSLFSAKLINKFGTPVVTAFSTALSGVSLLGFSFSSHIVAFLLLSVPLGLSAGAIDAALNGYVTTRYSSTHVNLLHCFYGVGVAITPYIFSITLSSANDWRSGYKVLFLIQIALCVVALLSTPLFKKVQENKKTADDFTPNTLSLRNILSMPTLKTNLLFFFFATALEFSFGTWACTYLVTHLGLTEAKGAFYLTLFYLGMPLSRFLSAIFCKKFSSGLIVCSGWVLVATGIISMFLNIPPVIKGFSLMLVGLGLGPTFPNVISQTPFFYGKENSQSLIGVQMAVCNAGILIAPPLFGVLAQTLTTKVFPLYVGLIFSVLIILFCIYQTQLKKLNKSLFNR